jgi:hypothetical protein
VKQKKILVLLVCLELVLSLFSFTTFSYGDHGDNVYYEFPRLEWKGSNPEQKRLQKQFMDTILPYTIHDDIKMYVAWGRILLSQGKSAIPAFGRAVEHYRYLLYLSKDYSKDSLTEIKSKYPLLKWVEDVYSRYKNVNNDEELELMRKYINYLDQKKDDFWRNLNWKTFWDLEMEQSIEDGGNTLYEVVDAFIAVGNEFLAVGERQKAKVAFLRAIYRRILNEQDKYIAHTQTPTSKKFENSYVLFGKGVNDPDLIEIKNIYYSIYKY